MSPQPVPPSVATSPLPDTLAGVAEHVHAHAGALAPLIVGVDARPGEEPALTAGVVPTGAGHPVELLLGIRVPDTWTAIGLVCGGRIRSLPGAPPAEHQYPDRVCCTHLVDRSGRTASVIGPVEGPYDHETTTVDDPPIGWVPDVLARALGRPTPPPSGTPAVYLDALWLDLLADAVLKHPNRRWTWPRVARLHPFVPTGTTPSPDELAETVRGFVERHPWSWLRAAKGAQLDAAQRPYVADFGEVVPLEEWFDDGSLARFLQRDLVPGSVLLPDVLATLPTAIGDCVLTALVETTTEGPSWPVG